MNKDFPMRALALILLAASPAAGQGIILALSGSTNPTLHRLNATTGQLISSVPVTGHQAIRGGMVAGYTGLVVIDGPDDGNPDRLLSIDNFTGAGTVVAGIAHNWSRHAITLKDQSLFVVGDNTLFKIHPTTGQATEVAPLSGSPRLDQVTAIGVSSSNEAYVTDTTDTDLFRLNVLTGQITWIGSVGQSDNPFLDLGSYYGGVLIGVRASGGIYRINLTTAAQTLDFPGSYTAVEFFWNGSPLCYANCDQSTANPVLTGNDFMCFIDRFVNQDPYANCNGAGGINAADFGCYLNQYASGCP